jgi:hypothetical protein
MDTNEWAMAMDDDTSRRTNQPDDDAFDDALDDLFGPPQSGVTPVPEPESGQPPAAPPSSYPRHDEFVRQQQQPIAPQATSSQGSPVLRILGFGCVGIFVLLVGCVVMLAIIGALFGDTTTASGTYPVP